MLPSPKPLPSGYRVIADGLRFPEGPVWMLDGSVILVEIEAQSLTRVLPDGRKETVAQMPGGPNGAALGPDGHMYITNNGGFSWHDDPVHGLRPTGKRRITQVGGLSASISGRGASMCSTPPVRGDR